jgi:hypothetical protein
VVVMARHMSSGTRRAPGQLRAALADGLNWRRGIRSRAAVSIAGSTINRWVLPELGAPRPQLGEDDGGEQGMERGQSVTWTDVARNGLHAK